MLKGTKRIAKTYSLDESKFLEFVKTNKEKYSIIEFQDQQLVSWWSVTPMVQDYRNSLSATTKEKKIKKK